MNCKILMIIFFSAFCVQLNAQNVGIGTNAPLSKLHVAGAIRSDTLIGPGVRNLFASPNGRIYDSLVVASALNWQIAGNNNITALHFLGTTNANDVVFKTNNIERARILSTGGVGIGTSTLDFANVGFQVSNGHILSGHDGGIIFKDPTAGISLKYWQFRTSNVTAGDFVIKTLNDLGMTQLDVMSMTRSGNVGIGTTLPSNKLEITSAAVNTSGLRLTNLTSASPTVIANGKSLSVDASGDVILTPSAADAWALLGNSGTIAGTNFLGTIDAQDLVFKTNNIEHVRTLASNGYFGIGTAAPTAKLDVVLTTNITASSMARFSRQGSGSVGWLSLFSGTAGADWNGMTQVGDKAIIFTNDNDPLLSSNTGLIIAPWTTTGNAANFSGIKIMENGNVGISVGLPTKKLDIISDANAAIYGTRNFNGVTSSDAGFIGGYDAAYTSTGVYFVQKDNLSLGNYGTNLINVVSNGVPKMVVNGTGNMRIGQQFFNSQSAGVPTAADVANVKLSVMGGFSAFGNFNNDPLVNPAAPDRSWVNGVGALVLGMNRQAGTSNVDFWNVSDPGNSFAALSPADRGFNWRNFNMLSGAAVENSLMTLNGLGNLTISGTNYFTSDRRLKTNIKSFANNTLSKVMQLQPSTYLKHSSGFSNGGNIIIHDGEAAISDFGFIAQDVYAIFPELVSKPNDESKELWSLDYSRLSVILTKALQEQQTIIQSQEARILKLEKALEKLLENK